MNQNDQFQLAMWLYANRHNPQVLAQLAPQQRQQQAQQAIALGTPPSLPQQGLPQAPQQQQIPGLGNNGY